MTKTKLKILQMCIIIMCTIFLTSAYAQVNLFQFTLSGQEYGKGRTFTIPDNPNTSMNCHAQLVDDNMRTIIDGSMELPTKETYIFASVQLHIELYRGMGKTTVNLNPKHSTGTLHLVITGPDGNDFLANGGTVTIDQYNKTGGYVKGNFTVTLLRTNNYADKNSKAYNLNGNFRVKRIQ
ncbi:MAG: hypothetical protein M1480_19335 [Bacteroidetes bacterium]|nr:hypothetical protein [Bacteroidota bacterium]